jgi:uncharacterized protein (DUF934 family)
MSAGEGTRDDPVADLGIRAQWRAQKAERDPADEKSTRSAEALRVAASDVAALADDDARLLRLAAFYTHASDAAVSAYLKEQNRIMSRHGFDVADVTTDDLLAALLEATEDAAR